MKTKKKAMSSPIFGTDTKFTARTIKRLTGKMVRIQYEDVDVFDSGIFFSQTVSGTAFCYMLTQTGRTLVIDTPAQIIRIADVDWQVIVHQDYLIQ